MVIAWVVLGAALLWFELHHMAFYALFGAVGCAAAAIVAALAPSAVPAQVLCAVVVATLGIITVRPFVNRRFPQHRGGHVALGVHGGLVGQDAVTLDEVGDPGQVGHARLAGERWLAISANGAVIPTGTKVYVMEVRGTTLVVWPSRELFGADGDPGGFEQEEGA